MGQKTNTFKTNFSSGEISPSMFGRLDVTRHKNGAAELNNFIVRPQGGLVRRTGTKFLHEVKDSSKKTRHIPFQFSNVQSYVLEFGHNVLRIIKDQQLVLVSGVPLELATIYDHEDLSGIAYAQSADVLYLTHPDYPVQKVSRTSDTSWTITNAEFSDGPYRTTRSTDSQITMWVENIDHRGDVKSTVAEFSVADINKHIEFWKDGNLIIGRITDVYDANTVEVLPMENVIDMSSLDLSAVIAINGAGTKVTSSKAIWSSETEYSFIKVGGVWKYMTTHDPIPTIVGTSPNSYPSDNMILGTDPVMKTTTGFLSFSNEVISAILKASSPIFTPTIDTGRHFRLIFGKRAVWGYITFAGTSTSCAARLGASIPRDPRDGTRSINNATTTDWRLGAWYTGNHPRAVTIHQGRLVFAGTYLEPNRFWMSESDDFVSFAPTNLFMESLDSNGINRGIGSGKVNTIIWLQSGPVLLVGTIGEEFQIKPSNISDPLTNTNISITPQTSYGSKEDIRPIKIGASTVFVQRHGQQVRELVYSFELDSFTAPDTTVVSEHIFRDHGYAIDMAYQQTPNSIIWFVCSDGEIVTLTYEKDQQVFAWSNSAIKNGSVKSICSIPASDNSQDEVYLIVERTIDGDTKQYTEVISSEFYPLSTTDYGNMVYLDCCKRYTGAATTTITGLSHLEGEEVSVLANFAVHPNVTVTGGQITLQYAASNVLVGYSYESTLKTLSEEGGSQVGTAHGKIKKIVRVDAHLLNSLGLKYGRNLGDLYEPISFRETTGILGSPPPLFTGFVELTDDSGFNKDGQFYIVQDQPYPLNILALMPIIVVNE